MGAVQDFIRKEFIWPNTETRMSTIILGLTPLQVVPNNSNRFALAIFNLSSPTGTAYLGFDGTVSTTYGMQINALGGNVTFSARNDLEIQTRQFWGVGSIAGVVLTIFETVAV